MKDGMTFNGVNYRIAPDTDEQKTMLAKNSCACHNYCALAQVCKMMVGHHGCILCGDLFLKTGVHFEYDSVNV